MRTSKGSGVFLECASAVEVKEEITFGGRKWKPTGKLAYVKASMVHSLPAVNSKRRAFTAETLANSFKTIVNNLVNFDHRLKFYGAKTDEVCGAVAAVELNPFETANKKKAVSLDILFALSRKMLGVDDALDELASSKNRWCVSGEWEYLSEAIALWDGEKAVSYEDASEEMLSLIKPGTVEDFNGKPMALLCGGLDGEVLFTGCALTKYPADKNARIIQTAASEKVLKLNFGWQNDKDRQEAAIMFSDETAASAWNTEDAPDSLFAYVPPEAKGKDGKKSLRKFPLASKEKKGLDPAILRNALARLPQSSLTPAEKKAAKTKILSAINSWNRSNPDEKITVSAKASVIIGQTEPSEDGHVHDITSNLGIMPNEGHSHWLALTDYDPKTGALEGYTGSAYLPSDPSTPYSRSVEHAHLIELGSGNSTAACAAIVVPPDVEEKGKMNKEKLLKFLRDQAKELTATAPTAAKAWESFADELARAGQDEELTKKVEETIAARITSGDLVVKAAHEAAVASAKKAGKDEVQKEIADKEKKDKEIAEAKERRVKAIADAKLDPKFVLGKDRTIESVTAGFPTDEAGEKAFVVWLEDLKVLRKTTGQAAQGTASDDHSKVVPTGGGSNGEVKRPAAVMV